MSRTLEWGLGRFRVAARAMRAGFEGPSLLDLVGTPHRACAVSRGGGRGSIPRDQRAPVLQAFVELAWTLLEEDSAP